MNLRDLLDKPLPATFRNYAGVECPIPFPKRSRLLARCGDAYLFRRNAGTFCVVYGLDLNDKLTRAEAADIFGHCCLHQAQCEGLLS